MTNFRFIAAAILVMQFLVVKSQTPTLDSIQHLIEKADSDTARIRLTIKYASELTYTNPAKSISLIDEVISESQSINFKKGEAAALYAKGIAEAFEGEYEASLDAMIRASKIYQKIGYRLGVAKTYGGIGNIYYFSDNFPKAIEYYKNAYSIYEDLGEETGIASCLNNLGLIYQETHQLEKSLEYQQKGLELEQKRGNKRGLAISHISIASLLISMEKLPEAKMHAKNAIDIAASLSDSSTLSDSYLRLAECYRKENLLDSAQHYLNKCIAINYKIKAYFQLAYALETQSKLYDSLGEYRLALQANRELIRIKDSLLNTEKSAQIIEMQTKFETEKKEKENIILTEHNKRQTVTLYSLIIFTVLIMLLAINIYNSRKKVRHTNSKLTILNGELYQQKEEIQAQAENLLEANKAIQAQKEQIETSHRKITDSIVYASIIQSAMLPSVECIGNFFTDYFIYYKPRDVVSGDFYWFKEKNGSLILTVADCTGHGVPGSLLSIMGISYLNDIVSTTSQINTSETLEELRKSIKSTFELSQSTDLRREGIEIAFCVFNPQSKTILYSGARLSLWISRDGRIVEYPADKMLIGVSLKEEPFRVTEVKLEPNDTIYLFTDGITDQLGGVAGKKYLRKNFIDYLSQISSLPLSTQKTMINELLQNWKGVTHDQTDDILVLGLKV
ncbi:MAG: tetratricopeptide repeat protein [Bacteroidales bacterium]|nr:tetratricopeptide repeat protein [Bacteroidales bacterium]